MVLKISWAFKDKLYSHFVRLYEVMRGHQILRNFSIEGQGKERGNSPELLFGLCGWTIIMRDATDADVTESSCKLPNEWQGYG